MPESLRKVLFGTLIGAAAVALDAVIADPTIVAIRPSTRSA